MTYQQYLVRSLASIFDFFSFSRLLKNAGMIFQEGGKKKENK